MHCYRKRRWERTDEEFTKEQDLRVEVLDSLMNLMQEHRLAKDMVMWDSTSRLVYEFWQAIADAEEKHKEGKDEN